MSKTVATDSIANGMILEYPIKNNFGQVLLGSGMELGEKHIRLLKTWNIEFVEIVWSDTDEKEEVGEAFIVQAMEQINNKLNWKPANKYEEDLFNMGVLNLAEKLLRGQQNGNG